MMTNFILVESEYSNIPDILLSMVRGFAESAEYKQLNEVDRKLPGVVVASFTTYFVKLLNKEHKEISESDKRAISSAFEAIEKLSMCHDEKVTTLIEEEIFENIRASKMVWDKIELSLGTHARAILTKWSEKKF